MARDQLAQLFREYDEYLSVGSDPYEYIYFPTSIVALNKAFGNVKGIRSGAIMQVLGEPGRGKTTFSLEIIANAQRQGLLTDIRLPNGKVINAAFADFERTFDAGYATKLGVDIDKIQIIRTPYAEQTFDILLALFEAGLKMAIIDSIAMIVPKSEDGKDLAKDNVKMASEAQALQRFMKLAVQHVFDANALLILINQYRSNISTMGNAPDKKAYGARSIQYAMQVSVDLTRISRADNRMTIKAFVEKTKQGATGKVVQFDIVHGQGIDKNYHLLEVATELNIIEKIGKGWYYYPNKTTPNALKGQGSTKAAMVFPMDEIENKVIEALSVQTDEEIEDIE